MSEFQIIYGPGRFPIQQRRADGALGCRGCGAAIPPNRQTWCSPACYRMFDPGQVIQAVKRRDKGICQKCGYDCGAAFAAWHKAMWETPYCDRQIMRRSKPALAEYDHIIPFSEGGLTILENMRTLCAPCHRAVTAAWRAAKRNPAGAEPR